MVGSSDRAKEALAMMALHEALRNVCVNSEWTYSVFWTIRPRPRSRGGNGNGCKVGEENGSLMLMWEDGYCRSSKPRVNRVPGPFNGNGCMDKLVKSSSFDCLEELDADDPVRKAFRKMSIQLYNYGEGLMGKVASDKCHKWVFKEPTECETGISNYWQSSFDAHPPEWTDQFASGIQTIAVIQAGHGLLQLGSCKIIPEDLHFVLRMRHTFESLGYQSGFYLSQLFAGARNGSPNNKPAVSPRPPPFNWSQRAALPTFLGPRQQGLAIPSKDESHLFLNNSNSSDSLVTHQVLASNEMMCNHQPESAEIKWPNGLSYLTALTARADDKHLFFGPEHYSEPGLPIMIPTNTTKAPPPAFQLVRNASSSSSAMTAAPDMDINMNVNVNMNASKSSNSSDNLNDNLNFEGGSASDYLSLEGPTNSHERFSLTRKMHNVSRLDKFKRSLTLPARMPPPNSPSSTQDQQEHHPPCTMDYTMNINSSVSSTTRHSEVGNIYSEFMDTFLE